MIVKIDEVAADVQELASVIPAITATFRHRS